MKHFKFIILVGLLTSNTSYAQQVPTGNPPTPTLPNQAASAWYRGGNFPIGTSPLATNNLFGTQTSFNSPIYTITDGILREKLNGDFGGAATQYSINGYGPAQGVNTSGYLLLGPNTPTQGGGSTPNLYQTKGAFSLLHLNGVQNSFGGGFTQEFGYRPWMQTGITYTGNNDLMYSGIRALAPGADQSEMLIAWSDNSTPGVGPDDFAFRFIGVGAGNSISTNLNDENDLDGRHIARFAPTGEFGLGSTFGNNAGIGALYVRPASLLHMSLDGNRTVWGQISNEGVGQTAADGLRWGLLGASNVTQNGNAFIYNQEDRHLIFSTNHATPANLSTTNERMRITSFGAPTNLPGAGYGSYTPPGSTTSPDVTRVSISYDPANPVTRPLSLLHMGYNGVPNDGWRPWMDVGMFIAKETDNTYFGLKNEGVDRQDAVLNWGDNQAGAVDNFRFIFTSSVPAGGTGPATLLNGLEGARMSPTSTTGIFTGFGGDPTAVGGNPYSTGTNPGNTLEVNSWGLATIAGGSSGLRFTDLRAGTSPTTSNPGPGVLTVNANGDVIYVPDQGGLGNLCGGVINPLTANYQVPMAGHSIYFHGGNSVQIGDVTPCTGFSPAREYIRNSSGSLNEGLLVETSISGTSNIAGHFRLLGGSPVGSYAGYFQGDTWVSGTGYFTGGGSTISDQMFKTDVTKITNGRGILSKLRPRNYKMDLINYPQFNFDDQLQYGFIAQEVEAVLPDIVKNSVSPEEKDDMGNVIHPSIAFKALNYNAIIPIAVQAINEISDQIGYSTISDQSIKTNVQNLTGSLAKVKQMRGVTYDWTPTAQANLNLDSLKHIGFIAQEINAIEPLLTFVDDSSLMHVNYDRLVPILVESIKELDTQLQLKDSALNSLQNQINQIANNMETCCNANHAMQAIGTTNNYSINVDLKDGQSIVLEQNVPNPFAEQTTISYFLPDDVIKAQILFYNAQGKLIQSTELTQKGKGQLNVFASDLTNGIYTYTLVVDGKIIETKKMVKQ